MTASSGSDQAVVSFDERVLRAAVAAYLGRYRGESRVHTGSDLKVFLTWCAGQELDPLNLGRAEIERFVRWLQESAPSNRRQCPGGCRSLSAFTGSASSTKSLPTRQPTTCAGRRCRPTRPPSASGTCSSKPC
jgi:integrase/recombinase XerD